MRTIETTVYTYTDLPTDEAKEKAREWYCENVATTHKWWDYVYEDAKAIGAIIGFRIEDIRFSGFWSQGDGASFSGSYYYAPGWREKLRGYCPTETVPAAIGDTLQAIQRPRRYRLQSRITASGPHYVHDGMMQAETELDDDGYATSEENQAIRECARQFARWIYERLEADYEYLVSDENAADCIVANEYEFTEDGRRCIGIPRA